MFMVALKSNPKRSLPFVEPEPIPKTFLSIIIGVNVGLVVLSHNLLRVTLLIGAEASHVCTITQVDNHVRLQVIKESPKPIKSVIRNIWLGVGAGINYCCGALTHTLSP
jgi:hypothetical protein